MSHRLHIVDGTFELFRAHYAPGPARHDGQGRNVKATVGVARSLLALLRDPLEAVTHIAVAFDNPVRSFRNELFEGYKTEEGIEPELLAQLDLVEEAVAALGIVVWSMDKYEADDALATAASRFAGAVEQVRILSPDKDLSQCLRGGRVVQVDRIRNREINCETLRERRGIRPESMPDYLALVGDDADGIPGIPGFGEKTAATLLGAFAHLEEIPTDPSGWPRIRGADRLAARLVERLEDVLLYRRLATLVTEVPLAESLSDLEWAGAPRERFNEWCAALSAEDLAARPPRWAA